MTQIKISEIPSGIWNFTDYFPLPIDRSEITVADFLRQRNVKWIFGDDPRADFRVYKEENIRNGLLSFRRIRNEYEKRFERVPYVNLNGEAQENSWIAYLLADPERTLSVAPGTRFKRLHFPSVWSDPLIVHWEERMDRICWIGRPLPERIRLAKKILEMGIGLDIYSREPWPLPNWKGFAADENQTSLKYKYRVVYENSQKNLYHSEKLFNSIRNGCVTFYLADPNLHLPHLDGAYVTMSHENLLKRKELSERTLDKMDKFMFSENWEVYSFKSFFNRIIDFSEKK
jgi:hypothetical protein